MRRCRRESHHPRSKRFLPACRPAAYNLSRPGRSISSLLFPPQSASRRYPACTRCARLSSIGYKAADVAPAPSRPDPRPHPSAATNLPPHHCWGRPSSPAVRVIRHPHVAYADPPATAHPLVTSAAAVSRRQTAHTRCDSRVPVAPGQNTTAPPSRADTRQITPVPPGR